MALLQTLQSFAGGKYPPLLLVWGLEKNYFPLLHNHGIKGAHESKQSDIKERCAMAETRREWRR